MLGERQKYYRSSERRPVQVEVTLYVEGMQPMKGTVGNISLGGMYVDTEEEHPNPGDTVRVEFQTPGKHGNQVHHLTARVTHSDPFGAGLVFENYNPDTIDALRSVMIQATRYH